MTRLSKAENDSESEEESRQPRHHWLFEKSEDRKRNIMPEFMMIKKGYLRTKMNSQAQGSECNNDNMPLSKRISVCVIKQKPNIKSQVKNLDSNDDEAESDSKSVEGYHAKCFSLFEKDKGTKERLHQSQDWYRRVI
ncbi:17686_t:CDS:1 [Acaulospora morrowiae]|uniref:17686_t:CDS:1 n=1 Tax=Acaulospora morrowiae TaxID=94023 RepID=A0A9N8VD58_9GLOM|nr:17686_t:CDS:1 [Acaulospora morrowiae]